MLATDSDWFSGNIDLEWQPMEEEPSCQSATYDLDLYSCGDACG